MSRFEQPGVVERSDFGSGGGGSFGRWARDEWGLPSYAYELDQHDDPRGSWQTRLRRAKADEPFAYRGGVAEAERTLLTLGADTGDTTTLHWHQIGNNRLIAVATNEGWVQLYSHEYGPRWINMYRPDQRCFAGGVSFVRCDDDASQLSSLYSQRPGGSTVDRTWGCGYFRYRVDSGRLELDRTVFAPFGDSPFLVSLVRLRNHGDAPLPITHVEYWDLNVQPLDATEPEAWHFDVRRRDALGALLYGDYACAWDAKLCSLVARHPWREIAGRDQDWPGATQRNRPDVSLVPLGVECDHFITDRAELLPNGDLTVVGPFAHGRATGAGEPSGPVLAAVSKHVLEPGQELSFGFAYGATPADETELEIARIRGVGARRALAATVASWRAFLPKVDVADDDLERELAWSSYYLRSGAVLHRAFNAHTLPQGGAYQYLAGQNAGPRATLQHALPLIWMAPDLAREALRFTFAETHPSGEIPYAENGNGAIDAMRYLPSDHALWLLWAASDYVLAARDQAFLRESCSYWPGPYTRPEPIWDHCVRAFRHLVDDIGFGPHGLLRMRTSDWNDAVVREGTVTIDRVWREGESTLNSAMAVHVLRRFAELARYAGSPNVAAESAAIAEQLAEAVSTCWRGRHLNRGWRAADAEVGWSDLYLEPQPWALIAEILEPDQAATLCAEIDERLDDPCGTRIFAAGEEGNPPTAGGGQWLSINSTLVWGLSKYDAGRAWKELKANTLHNHANLYPDVWFGIWSGPDTYLPSSSRFAGETWAWPGVFAMQAWPIQILFSHSEPLNGFLWLAGVEPCADRLRINPSLPRDRWSWQSQALAIEVSPETIDVRYTAQGSEVLPVEIAVPHDWRGKRLLLEIDGEAHETEAAGELVTGVLPLTAGRAAALTLRLLEGTQAERRAADS